MKGSLSIDFNSALLSVIKPSEGTPNWVFVSEALKAVCDDPKLTNPEAAFEYIFPLAPKPVFELCFEAIANRRKLILPYQCGNDILNISVEGHVFPANSDSQLLNFHFSTVGKASLTPEVLLKQNLFERRQLYQRIAENFPRGTIDVLDKTFHYIYTEGTEYRKLNIAPSSLIGLSHLDLFSDEERDKSEANLRKVLEGEMVSFETQLWGNVYLSNAVPLKNENGEIDHILLVHQNITNAKKLEAEREVLIKDLESHNEELLRFAYIVSHNLRAPIVNISLLLDLYNEDDPSHEENMDVIENLKISTNLLNATLQDLIEVVSIKKQKIPKVEPINFHLLLNNIEKSLFNQLKESGIRINRDFNGLTEMNYVYAHLENFFMNFLTNSVKYKHPNRPPEVWIRTYKESDYCVIQYKDNGIGLDLDRYGDRLFGLYQRFHNHVEGKGMGLYLVREQIRANDGMITVNSKVGEGLEFTIRLRNLLG